jgi:hypothetical protein
MAMRAVILETRGITNKNTSTSILKMYQLYPSLEDFNTAIGYASTWRNENNVWTKR